MVIDTVLADVGTEALEELEETVAARGARLIVADVAADDGSARHDPDKLAAVLRGVIA